MDRAAGHVSHCFSINYKNYNKKKSKKKDPVIYKSIKIPLKSLNEHIQCLYFYHCWFYMFYMFVSKGVILMNPLPGSAPAVS